MFLVRFLSGGLGAGTRRRRAHFAQLPFRFRNPDRLRGWAWMWATRSGVRTAGCLPRPDSSLCRKPHKSNDYFFRFLQRVRLSRGIGYSRLYTPVYPIPLASLAQQTVSSKSGRESEQNVWRPIEKSGEKNVINYTEAEHRAKCWIHEERLAL